MEEIEIGNKKPVYSVDEALCCGVIDYNGRKYLMELKDRDLIINFSKKFLFAEESDIYPSYQYNQHRINYLQFLYYFRDDVNVKYVFKYGNQYDLRRCNVQCVHKYHDYVIQHYKDKVLEYSPGHFVKNGVDPYSMKNPLWVIRENENDKEYLLMYCEKDTLCKLCIQSYQKILEYESNNGKKMTWFKLQNGYIMGSNNLYIHQIIMNCYGNGKGTKNVSVDHIDQNPLNNTFENLRIATRSEQEQNTKGIKDGTKRERKHSAKDLPEGITQNMMRKYVVYYKEWVYPEKIKTREYFKIEKHPKLSKIWIGTKSHTVSIQEKLEQANKKIIELDEVKV